MSLYLHIYTKQTKFLAVDKVLLMFVQNRSELNLSLN